MARHRSDPGGTLGITIAIVAIVIAITLLGVGGYALFKAVDTSQEDPASPGAAPSSTAPSASNSTPPVLTIAVTGDSTGVYVGIPGGGEVLVNRVLQRGETFIADKPRLNVVVDNSSAVRIRVNGKVRALGKPNQRVSFTVDGDKIGGADS